MVLGLLGGACSNSNSSTPESQGDSGKKGNTIPDSAMNQPQMDGTPRRGGTLTFGLESSVLSLDPGGAMIQPADLTVGLALYDSLVQYDDKGRTTGGLAETITNSDDLKTWTFKLRPDLKFGDGTPLNSAAVKAHVERLMSLPKCSCASSLTQIESITTPDDLSVVFQLKEPNVAFAVVFANSPGYIVSPAQVAKYPDTFGQHPMGAGAFRLVSMGDTITVERNPYYWRKDAKGEALPYLDGITFKPLPDSKTRLQALQSGDVQIIQTADTDNLVEARKDSKLVVQPVTGSSSTILILNKDKPPFNDIRARQALNYAIDRDALNQQAYQGARVPAYGFIPPTDAYFDSDPDAQLPGYDPEKARALIKELKDEGKEVDFGALCISTPEATTDFQVLKAQAEEVGVNVTLTQLDQSTFVNKMFSGDGDFQAACFRSPQFADPNDVNDTIHTGGSMNIPKVSNPVIDEALDKGRSVTDFDKRKEQYDIVQREMAKDAIIVPLLFDLYGNIHVQSVSGLERPWPNALGLINAAYLYYKAEG